MIHNDYAEVFRKPEDEVIEPGDVVCIRADGLAHKFTLTDNKGSVIGICSDTEGVLLGGKDIPEQEQVIVGLVGQIWVKTNNEHILPGQMVYLLSDGTVTSTNNINEKFGVALTKVSNNKIRILYNG